MSSIFVLDRTAGEIDQAINAAYTGLVLAGTGLVRTTGDQSISGKKTFHGAVDFTGSPINFTGVSSFIPFSNASIDVGSSSRTFRTGFFSGVSGYTGYFENLRVGNLITSLIPSLVNVTGNNMTLSGTTNISTANVSGNLGVSGNLLVRGATTLSGDVSFLGAVLSTGNKTFSGVLNQSGNVNIYGRTLISGNSSFTGDVNITGNSFLQGNQNITGDFTHTGRHFVNSNNTSIIFTGDGQNHAFRVRSPMYLDGTIYHSEGSFINSGSFSNSGPFSNSGLFSNSGSFLNSGPFSNVGTSTLSGDVTVSAGSSVNFNANPKFNSGISCSGNSITPSIRINPNLVSSPSGGAIEYSRGQFFATNELTGGATRVLINPTYSYIAPPNFYSTIPIASVSTPLLGSTGINLNTGRYHIKYDIKFSIPGTTNKTIALGITGDHITNRIGTLTSSVDVANASVARTGFHGETSTAEIILSGVNINNTAGDTWNNFYIFDATITITGATKIRPIFRMGASPVTLTARAFSMEVTQLATGTGVGLVGASGPWSDS